MRGLLLAIVLVCSAAHADSTAGFDHLYRQYASILKQVVFVNGYKSAVDYRALQSRRDQLLLVTDRISQVSAEAFSNFTSDQKLAFLINAYNSFTLLLIVENYPVKSIKDVFGGEPWKTPFFTLLGRKMTLDELENELIRARFHEPRVHFALVCAAVSCPPLREAPYLAQSLDGELEDAARRFLGDSDRNSYSDQKIKLSRIFQWFDSDFIPPGVRAFVSERISDEAAKFVMDPTISLEYYDYDWSLNDYQGKK